MPMSAQDQVHEDCQQPGHRLLFVTNMFAVAQSKDEGEDGAHLAATLH